MNFDGILAYQEKDQALVQLQNDYNNSKACINNRKAIQILEYSKKNIESLETEIDAIVTKYSAIKKKVEDIKKELDEFDEIIASAETTEDVDYYTRKIGELQDKLIQAEKDLNADANKIEAINLDYVKNLNTQKQATNVFNESTVAKENLKNQIMAKGKPVQLEMEEIAKSIEPALMNKYRELKKSKVVKVYPLIAEVQKGTTYCFCGMELEKETANILKNSGALTQCSRCHRLIFTR